MGADCGIIVFIKMGGIPVMSKDHSRLFVCIALAGLMLLCNGCSVVHGRISGIKAEGAYRGVDYCCERTHPQLLHHPLGILIGGLCELPVICWYGIELPFAFITDSVFYPLDIAWAWMWTDGHVPGWKDIDWHGKPCPCCNFHPPSDPREIIEYFCGERFAMYRREGREISLDNVRLNEATRTRLIQSGLVTPCQIDMLDQTYLDTVRLAVKTRGILNRETIEPVLGNEIVQECVALWGRAKNLPLSDNEKAGEHGNTPGSDSVPELQDFDRPKRQMRIRVARRDYEARVERILRVLDAIVKAVTRCRSLR